MRDRSPPFTVVSDAGVVPAFVSTRSVVFDEDAAEDPSTLFPMVHLPEAVRRAAPRRQLAFLAGRYCAQRALHLRDVAWDADTLGVGEGGAPLWPADIVGSITHTRGFASAAVGSRSSVAAVGIDSEEIMSQSQADEVRRSIVTPDELEESSPSSRARELLTVAFSAKESVYKCLYPLVRRWFDYLDASVTLEPDPVDDSRGVFLATLKVALSPELDVGTQLRGRFVVDARYVHTGVVWGVRDPARGADSRP